MATTRGPLMSLAASGSLAHAVTYNHGSLATVARRQPRRTTRVNPRSTAQRVITSWLTRHWTHLSSQDQATWQPLANRRRISPRLAYIGANLTRWAQGKPPAPTPHNT
jgi:hypothetical protein